MQRLWRLIEGDWARNLANKLSIPKERTMQNAQDYERLYQLCRLNEMAAQGHVNHHLLLLETRKVPLKQQRAIVDEYVRSRLGEAAVAMHQALVKAGDPTVAAARLEHAARSDDKPQASPSSSSASTAPGSLHLRGAAAAAIGREELALLLQPHLGFSLRVGPSSINHAAAGLGVFLDGSAPPGTVVAVLPGLTYSRTQYSRMPNFPRIDLGNPYLSRRHDMDIIDSLPWGLGRCSGATAAAAPSPGGPGGSGAGGWPRVTCPESRLLLALDGRNPMAVGHLVNHPGEGMQPNVLEVGFTWEPHAGEPPWLRAYIPNVRYLDLDEEEEEEEGEQRQPATSSPGMLASSSLRQVSGAGRGQQKPGPPPPPPPPDGGGGAVKESQLAKWAELLIKGGAACSVRGMALVTTRTVKDGEELLQNYRLNPRGPQPSWYVPIDVEEDARKWAQLPLINIMAPPRAQPKA